jgi:chorismate synthase
MNFDELYDETIALTRGEAWVGRFSTRKVFSGAIARRWLSQDKVRWLSVERALKEIDEQREGSTYDEALLLEGLEAFYRDKKQWAEDMLAG